MHDVTVGVLGGREEEKVCSDRVAGGGCGAEHGEVCGNVTVVVGVGVTVLDKPKMGVAECVAQRKLE